jgi:hypothetical protein
MPTTVESVLTASLEPLSPSSSNQLYRASFIQLITTTQHKRWADLVTMADPKSIREQLSDLTTLAHNLETTMKASQIQHNDEIKYYQRTIDDLVKSQELLKKRNISLEAKQDEVLIDIKLLKKDALRDAAQVSVSKSSVPNPNALNELYQELDSMNDRISQVERDVEQQRYLPEDLANRRADLKKATQNITTLQAKSHNQNPDLEDPETSSRTFLSKEESIRSRRDAGRGRLSNHHEAPLWDLTKYTSGSPRVVYEISSEDEDGQEEVHGVDLSISESSYDDRFY